MKSGSAMAWRPVTSTAERRLNEGLTSVEVVTVRVQKSVNHLTEELHLTLCNSLEAVAPLKTKNISHKKLAPWVYRKYLSPEASFQKFGAEMAPHQTGSLPTSLERQYRAVSKSPHCCLIILFFQLNWGKEEQSKIYFVAKLNKNQHSPREDGFHFSSDKFIIFFEEKIMIIWSKLQTPL